MITQIHAQNFKSWKDTGDLRLAPLTGLFGANNSGKTSILQMLLLMKQTVESEEKNQILRIGDDSSLINLGTFSDIIHGHQLSESLRLSFSWKPHKPLFIEEPESKRKQIQELSFTTLLYENNDRPAIESFVYEFDHSSLGIKVREKDIEGKQKYKFTHGHSEQSMEFAPPEKCYKFPDNLRNNVATEFVMPLAPALEDLFHRISYLESLRDCARRSYSWSGHHPDGVGTQGEQVLATFLAARIGGGESARREQQILEWLQHMGLVYSYSLNRIDRNNDDYEICVKTSEASPEVLLTDVGSGVPQILPVLVQCYYGPESSIVLLEQPETHLHPLAQAGLADVFIDVIKDKKRKAQIILESHSEHLLRRLQRRIAEEKLSPNDVALYFCRIENGESKIDLLELDKFGNIANWPQNFFGDEMGDLVAMTEAAMKRETESDS